VSLSSEDDGEIDLGAREMDADEVDRETKYAILNSVNPHLIIQAELNDLNSSQKLAEILVPDHKDGILNKKKQKAKNKRNAPFLVTVKVTCAFLFHT
jgi:hypothetical protein